MSVPPTKRPVLLIDDSHEDLFLVKRLLTRAGVDHPLVTIDGGDEAIVFLQACLLPEANNLLPLVIFCDVKMPGRNGFDVLEWIRAHQAFERLPIYMLSGADLERDRQRALDAGANGYLGKFPTPDELKRIIDGVAR